MTVGANSPEKPAAVPYFHGTLATLWSPRLFYRVFVLPGELMFFFLGSTRDVSKSQAPTMGGLRNGSSYRTKENLPIFDVPSEAALQETLAKNKNHFRVPQSELQFAKIDRPLRWTSWIRRLSSHPGTLHIQHPVAGSQILCFNSIDDMRVAIIGLPMLVSDQISIQVVWNKRKRKYERKRV